MTLHGGGLSAYSAGAGQGSTFSMELPLYRKSDDQSQSLAVLGSEVTFLEICFNADPSRVLKADASQSAETGPSRLPSPSPPWSRTTGRVVPIASHNNYIINSNNNSSSGYEAIDDDESAIVYPRGPSPAAWIVGEQEQDHELQQDVESGACVRAWEDTDVVARKWATGLNILVVDDSSPNRKVMRSLLSSRGHAVEEAVDGKDFLRVMGYLLVSTPNPTSRQARFEIHRQRGDVGRSALFDIILIDDNMPFINGSDAVQLLRASGYRGKILGITGDVDEESVRRFIGKGVNEVLCKPVNIEILRSKVEALLC
jgi:CheY-like chemotaxis protein